MPTSNTAAQNRFEQVRNILREAAGDSTSDYGGLGPPWELPRDRLLTASLYGVRSIAPEADAKPSTCCAHEASTARQSRADRSGLIHGLRGEPPFDGTRFPR